MNYVQLVFNKLCIQLHYHTITLYFRRYEVDMKLNNLLMADYKSNVQFAILVRVVTELS